MPRLLSEFTLARPEVRQLYRIPFDEHILRFNISMEDTFAMNVFDGFE